MQCDAVARFELQLVIAIFSGLSSLLSIYLSFRAKRVDQERSWFYRQMRGVHELEESDYRRGHSTRTQDSH